jgi:hypothetical protein
MSNKINKYFLLIGMLIFCAILGAVEFKQTQFTTEYQFALYRAWLARGGFSTQVPTRFFSAYAESRFGQDAAHPVLVRYLWQDGHIYSQREIIPLLHQVTSQQTAGAIDYFEAFLYRLNSRDGHYVTDFYQPEVMHLQWGNATDEEALQNLLNWLSNRRLPYSLADFRLQGDFYVLQLALSGSESLTCRIDTTIDFEALLPQLENRERGDATLTVHDLPSLRRSPRTQSTAPIQTPHQFSPPEPTVTIAQPSSTEELPIPETGLFAYIKHTWQQPRHRELLNNKIGTFEAFLRQDFPHHTIERNGLIYTITPPDSTILPGQIAVEVQRTKDGYNIQPAAVQQNQGNTFVLSSGEGYSLAALTSYQRQLFQPLLARFIYQHRALGSRLFNFLLEQNNTPATLAIRGTQEAIYDLPSYASLLLMLHSYVQGWQSYYTIGAIRYIDGGIEFQGFLTLRHPDTHKEYNAEINYRMNDDCKLKYTLMTLYINE